MSLSMTRRDQLLGVLRATCAPKPSRKQIQDAKDHLAKSPRIKAAIQASESPLSPRG